MCCNHGHDVDPMDFNHAGAATAAARVHGNSLGEVAQNVILESFKVISIT